MAGSLQLTFLDFWPGTETKREAWLLRTWFGIAPVKSWCPWLQWRNPHWSIPVNEQVALWTEQVALPSEW